MKGFVKNFCLRGLVAMGFGPIILAIIYGIIGATGQASSFGWVEIVKGFLSISVMAFVAGGAPLVYQVEQLPLASAILIHGGVLYLDYLILYLFNDWIAKNMTALGVFSIAFVVGFALVWVVIYAINKRNIRKLNRMLSKE